MLASTFSESSEACATEIVAKTAMRKERPGSERYQRTHMAEIFQQGLSFSGFERNKLFLNGGDRTFADLSDVSGADSELDCRAACVADFDDDGDPDLFVNSIQRRLFMLYRNDAGDRSGNRGVKLRLRGTKGRPDAVGAIVKVERLGKTQAQVLGCGGGFETQHAPELIFGLGKSESARVRVRWPGRAEEDFGVVAAGSRVTLVEGTGKPEPFAAKSFQFGAPLPAGVRLRVGDVFPAFATKDVDGKNLRVGPGDKKLLVNLWSTTCRACLGEMPALDKLAQSGRYRVVGLAVEPPSRAASVRETGRAKGATFELALYPDAEVNKLVDLEKLPLPTTLVVGTDGKIERILQGAIREGSL